MIESRDAHLVNALGAFALALADRVRDATEAVSEMTGAAPASLVALLQFLAGPTTEDLAQAMGLTHSGAVRLVDRLVDATLVERRPGRDGRSSAIVLTASGRALSRKLSAARGAAVGATLEGLNARDRRTLSPLIDTLIGTMTSQRLDARSTSNARSAWLCRLCNFEDCGRPQGDCPAATAANDHVDQSASGDDH